MNPNRRAPRSPDPDVLPPVAPAHDRGACGIGFVTRTDGDLRREIVDLALTGLARMRHRQAVAADGRTGDGAGLLVPIPRAFFARVARDELGVDVDPARIGVIFLFLDRDVGARRAAEDAVVDALANEAIDVLGWRDVPVRDDQLGDRAGASAPAFRQAIITTAEPLEREAAARAAYRARRMAEQRCRDDGVRMHVASWGFATVTYKALVLSDRLPSFFPDLEATDFVAPLAVFHSRFSTNTTPAWARAQPFRMLCHNGEINTDRGNQLRMHARGHLGTEDVGLGSEELFRPLLDPADSDSGRLDTTLELLVRGGRDVRHAIAMLVPEAWEGNPDLAPAVRDFYRYHACLTEPWDGPAGLVFTDGRRVGAALDRNGLRPLRWSAAADGTVVCASEAGAVPLDGRGAVRRGRLGPGEMLCVDTESGGIQTNEMIKAELAERAAYRMWVRHGLRSLHPGDPTQLSGDAEALARSQVAFGVTKEEVATVLKPMATDAKEPTFSMGDDTPIPPLSSGPRPVFHFLKQRFAQVSNPPIDHLRERRVMSLRTCLGARRPLLSEVSDAARLLELPTFLVTPSALAHLLDPDRAPLRAARLEATFAAATGPDGMADAIARLADAADVHVAAGVELLVLSDAAADVPSAGRVPIPTLLATGAVHHRLMRSRRRQDVSIVVDSGDARDVHAVAGLLGYGADAICPRLALATVANLADTDELGEIDADGAQTKLQVALEDGVLKIMAKMGISTLDGYRAAQVFEVLGLDDAVVDECLPGTPSAVGGLGYAALAAELLVRHAHAADDAVPALEEPGLVRFRKRGGEYHASNPEVFEALHAVSGVDEAGRTQNADQQAAHALQAAIRDGRSELYARFARLVESRPPTELHDLLELAPLNAPVDVDEVEPASAIVRRFSTGAMSHGSLSSEAHETLAIAMNLLGGKSNCGEGGEDPSRYRTRGHAVDRNSRIKQIASGRFGVTPEYCAFADELNIKMAQGSKPGEGGQLPGHKVTAEIARLRHTQRGVGLISPPPHHDIYSIEDLAQLIFDLKQVNPAVDVSVKLVAEAGIGTIACGVVKGRADIVQVSGGNGGTGASPLSSIKHAGMPWELGLAEVQRALVADGLRSRVRIRVDGGFKTGRDVMIAALLGADEYSFGTAVMLAEGCIMVRACHRDTCPTGIATQRPNLRAKFAGTPEGVATYLLFVAKEVRTLLAALGLRSLDDAIGQVGLLTRRPPSSARAAALDLSGLLAPPTGSDAVRFVAPDPSARPRSALDERLLHDGFRPLWEGDDDVLEYAITNADRTVGASLGGAVGLEWGERVPPGSVQARFTGAAGQSFGAFLADGVMLELVGEANDYVGKGMGGGRIVIRPPDGDAGDPVLAGNTLLYGATGGQLFVAGRVGERFMVRNSGAVAVVEGTGDHACEYMTGGTAVILGPIGYNLGAGMTGGEAYVYDPDGLLATRLNRQLVDAGHVDELPAAELRFLVERHRALTGSRLAAALLADWDATVRDFRYVAPLDEIARIERANQAMLGATR